MELTHIYHLYRRAGFGITPENAQKLIRFTRSQVVDMLIDASTKPTPMGVDLSMYDDFFSKNPKPKYREFKPLIQKTGQLRYELNKVWLERLCDPTEELNERLTLFWANIFVCKDNVVLYVQKHNDTLREHALGNFKDFIKAISKEPAMIKYLNTNRNKKYHPNENFARELMELFSLGVGNYSEQDIKEAARAFTGYSFRLDGTFKINYKQHDDGVKEFLGDRGNFDGDDVIDVICNQPQCARYICTRLYNYFVNEKPNEAHIEELIDVFYPSYEIKDVMRYMFTADWFYSEENIGTKIKSPIDLLTSINKVVPFRFVEDKEHIYIQRALGQLLLSPPNVAGWKGGRSWINTNTMLLRLKLPSVLLGDGFVPSHSLPLEIKGRSFGDRLSIRKKWRDFDDAYGNLSREDLILAICGRPLEQGTKTMLNTNDNFSKRDYALQLMSLPEFQLT